MKFGFFTLGPVVKPLDNDTWDEGQEHKAYHNWLDQYELADQLGYDYLFAGEHHYQSEYTHIPAPEIFLAALSQRTRNARLGTSIAHVSMYHGHPARVAERASMMDILTDGRWEFGTGPAGYNDGPGVYNAPYAVEAIQNNGSQIWQEGLHEIVRMMTEEPYGGAKTEYFNISPFTLVPRPVQKPHPPLWRSVSSVGSERCAKLGVGTFNLGRTGVEQIGEAVDEYWNGFRQGVTPVGKAINPATAAFLFTFCAKTDEEAIERGQRGMDLFSYGIGHMRRDHSRYRHLNRSFTKLMAGGEVTEIPFESRTQGAMIGSPETIARELRRYEATNVDVIVFYQSLGDTKHEYLMESAELLATKVLPEFRERHEKHEKWRSQQLADAEFPVNSTV